MNRPRSVLLVLLAAPLALLLASACTVVDPPALSVGSSYSLSRGTMVVDYGPIPFDGSFVPSRLDLWLNQGEMVTGAPPDGRRAEPLPDGAQPPQDDPVGDEPVAAVDQMPELQLFDRSTGRWLEFAHLGPGSSITVAEPERYVDSAGHFLVRFVNRQAANTGIDYFMLIPRLEGSLP